MVTRVLNLKNSISEGQSNSYFNSNIGKRTNNPDITVKWPTHLFQYIYKISHTVTQVSGKEVPKRANVMKRKELRRNDKRQVRAVDLNV